jgi:hypothetical protein
VADAATAIEPWDGTAGDSVIDSAATAVAAIIR